MGVLFNAHLRLNVKIHYLFTGGVNFIMIINLPVYQYTSHRYNAEKIAEVLLNPKLPSRKIATSRPVCIQDNVTFVVDLSKLQKRAG